MLNILVVDDSRAIRMKIAEDLEAHAKCSLAGNGREAVQLFDAAMETGEPFDVAFLDIMMPEMDGIKAAQMIRELERERGVAEDRCVKLVMISCLDDPEHMMRAGYEAGVNLYLTKPFDRGGLNEALVNLGCLGNPFEEGE